MDFKQSNYYTLLNCHKDSSVQQILTEYKIKALEYHPDKNSTNDIKEHFHLLTKAKNILTNPESKNHYDRWLASNIPLSFDNFLEMAKFGATHWTHGDSLKSIKDDSSKDSSSINYESMSLVNDPHLEYTKSLFRTYKI